VNRNGLSPRNLRSRIPRRVRNDIEEASRRCNHIASIENQIFEIPVSVSNSEL